MAQGIVHPSNCVTICWLNYFPFSSYSSCPLSLFSPAAASLNLFVPYYEKFIKHGWLHLLCSPFFSRPSPWAHVVSNTHTVIVWHLSYVQNQNLPLKLEEKMWVFLKMSPEMSARKGAQSTFYPVFWVENAPATTHNQHNSPWQEESGVGRRVLLATSPSSIHVIHEMVFALAVMCGWVL